MNLDNFSKEYLLSEAYVSDMMGKVSEPYDEYIKFLYDAEPGTPNYVYRHNHQASDIASKLGGWRWKGLFTFREQIVPILYDKTLKGVDFGGAQRPISSHIDIIDLDLVDYYKRPVKFNSLSQIEHKLDFIFSSHTFEHIPNLSDILNEIYDALTVGGKLIVNLPSYTCIRWRANNGEDMGGTEHQHTFKLSKTNVDEDINNLKDIDTVLEDHGFKVILAEYTGDNSIVLILEK